MLLEKMLATILILLFIITIITIFIGRKVGLSQNSELFLRIRTWWIIVILFSLALLSPYWIALCFLGFISFLALKEYLILVPSRQSDRMPILWMFLAIPINYLLIGQNLYGIFIIFIPIYVFLFLPARMVIAGDTHGFLRTVAELQWGLMTTIFAFSHVALLLMLPKDSHQTGALFVLYLIILTEFNDVAQYVWGKSFGYKKIIPKVSPNKTVAGFIGGIISTIILSMILAQLIVPLPLNIFMAFISGLIISLTGFCGDVTISAIKRDIGIKDSGNLLPGHGGILDRMDSIIFTAPIFFHFIRYFYY